MREWITNYVAKKLEGAENFCETKWEVEKLMHMSLGAVQFYVTYLDADNYEEIFEWWSWERRKFDEIAERKVS